MLNRKIFQNAFFNLFQTIMILVQNLLCAFDIFADTGLFAPRHTNKPIKIIAYNRCLGCHRAHLAELFNFFLCALACFLRKLSLIQSLLKLGNFIQTFAIFAKLFLNRLHLFVQIILALRFFHLTLHTVTDALFYLQDANLAFHKAINAF